MNTATDHTGRWTPTPYIRIGLLVVGLTFVGFLGWSWLAILDSAVLASGKVTVHSQRKAVQSLQSGRVGELAVSNGEMVRRGDVLVRLDDTRARAGLVILEDSLFYARATEVRLDGEMVKAEELLFPDALIVQTAGNRRLSNALTLQEQLFYERQRSHKGKVEIIRQRIEKIGEQIVGLQGLHSASTKRLAVVQEELDGLNKLLGQGFIQKMTVNSSLKEEADLQGKVSEYLADIAEAETSITEARLEILQLEQDRREQLVSDLNSTRAQINDLEERVRASRYMLEQLDVLAPADGVIVDQQIHTVGGVVQAGETLMEIVPERDALIIEARMNPMDVDQVHIGQSARVQLTAFPQRTTPQLNGRVLYASADSLVDESTREPYYLVHIEVGSAELERLGDKRLQPGMPADVMITTGSRTALEYLTQPLRDSFNKAWRES
ncbi:HlyD family type I secretion periplasmic adaptor subunit [Parendozoicomonas haliclonae]|uniref:Membrane fusion protein (MFP) family protein n=1 Tax=Parendozoicomonas haliclonae TaxID=1960125 RepID=A0A1X7AJR4_9GAMM|nr:HlyD family type I secretion periplasmic adaptor subunit [Parendozoicomonas haliclonae]SMA47087.1 Type I secretion system membrane fusion protein PrsE [Parendozoicomonas haliclonae]